LGAPRIILEHQPTEIMETQANLLVTLRAHLKSVSPVTLNKKVFIGFDGFIDNIQKAVKERRNYKTIYFKTIKDFAERLKAASGKSGQVELVTEKTKLGGNAPILANSLGRIGIRTFCAGSMGYPRVHPVFSALSDKCEVISVALPGESDAIEFDDGKIIFSDLQSFESYDWKHICSTVGLDKIKEAVCSSDMVALVDWANLPHASDLWDGLLQNVIKPSGRKDFSFLFDLCDPSKNTAQQIDDVLDLISCFSSYGNVTLGLNENETLKIWSAIHGVDYNDASARKNIPTLKEASDMLFKNLNIHCLMVHPIDRTLVFRAEGPLELMGRLVTKPKVLTGGGDNLNAGYTLGVLARFSMEHCMLLGMAASGAYIENGRSADIDELIQYVDLWISSLDKHSAEAIPASSDKIY
jgi:hypothetical protein